MSLRLLTMLVGTVLHSGFPNLIVVLYVLETKLVEKHPRPGLKRSHIWSALHDLSYESNIPSFIHCLHHWIDSLRHSSFFHCFHHGTSHYGSWRCWYLLRRHHVSFPNTLKRFLPTDKLPASLQIQLPLSVALFTRVFQAAWNVRRLHSDLWSAAQSRTLHLGESASI